MKNMEPAGFTLIELMMPVAILLDLGAFVVPAVHLRNGVQASEPIRVAESRGRLI
jgi:prepilin-type N-terminal cleavage/methylation domain-containing protein